ncbi:hypothetical protein ABBQ38_009713 [Trebouxia sp. C0009 RCD-2024]
MHHQLLQQQQRLFRSPHQSPSAAAQSHPSAQRASIKPFNMHVQQHKMTQTDGQTCDCWQMGSSSSRSNKSEVNCV